MMKMSSIYTLNIEKTEEKIKKLTNKILTWNIKANKIRGQFSFLIPDYLIDEIIENEADKNYNNLHYLCNMACICGRITEEECKLIKMTYR